MPLPPVATIAACGSIITAFKSGWELSRMLKKKDLEKKLDKEARCLLRDLQKAYLEGLMTEKSFEKWYDRYLGALADKDTAELRKVRQHINLVRTDQARLTRRNTIANRRSSTYPDEKHVHHRQKSQEPRSRDDGDENSSDRIRRRRRYSYSSTRDPEYSVHEYEEERRRPGHVDTTKAQRDYYYAHALPSPYKGMIEDTPLDEVFDDDDKEGRGERERRRRRRSRHHRRDNDDDDDDDDDDDGHARGRDHGHSGATTSRTESYRSRSNSTYDRGRPRSRSTVTTERSRRERVVEVSTSDADSEAEADHDRRRGVRRSHGGGGHGRGREPRRRDEWVADAGA